MLTCLFYCYTLCFIVESGCWQCCVHVIATIDLPRHLAKQLVGELVQFADYFAPCNDVDIFSGLGDA